MNEHAQNVLTAGGAPQRWRREMKRDVARLDVLDRASAWVGPLVSTLGGLCQESIFGDCLATVLAGTESTARAETAASHRPRPRFAGPFESETGERRAANNEPEPFTERTAKFSVRRDEARAALTELPRQADQELLRRLADVSSASSNIRRQHSNPASSGLNAAERNPSQQTGEVEPTRGASARAHLPFELPHETLEASQRRWQDELVRRIKHVISQAQPMRSELAEPEHDLPVWPWSTPFSGPTVSSELLGQLINPPRRDRGASNNNGHSRGSGRSLSREQKNGALEEFESLASTSGQQAANSRANYSRPDDRSREDFNASGNPSSVRAEHMTPSTRARESRKGAEDGQASTGSTAAQTRGRAFSSTDGSLSQRHPAQVKPSWSEFWEPLRPPEDNFDPRMEDAPSASGWARQIEPPTIATQLPPLIPPQMVGMPVLPVAAATARQGARAEEAADEDLDVLAARIKRILDEEARRHGIDV